MPFIDNISFYPQSGDIVFIKDLKRLGIYIGNNRVLVGTKFERIEPFINDYQNGIFDVSLVIWPTIRITLDY